MLEIPDIHLKETEDAVQSISVFDDTASHQSADEEGICVRSNYMSDGTSRRSSLAEAIRTEDTINAVASEQEDSQVNFQLFLQIYVGKVK